MVRLMTGLVALMPAVLPVAAAAAPEAAAWKVAQTQDSPAILSRSLEALTITYTADPEDYNSLKVTVDHCGDGDWWIKDSINPVATTLSGRNAELRKAIAEDLHNARLNCTLPDGVEDRIMTGFDEAYAQFEKLDQ